jgi:hypothetical protein
MLLDDCPYEFKIDPEVLVNDHVSEPDYLLPRDLTVSLAQFWGYPPGRPRLATPNGEVSRSV